MSLSEPGVCVFLYVCMCTNAPPTKEVWLQNAKSLHVQPAPPPGLLAPCPILKCT